ncbi:MAG: 50S ribosomal protein L9 [Salinisphaeraceae bacterium]|nr:50S ribosomal protein L9 [Salinisphaeraceae bacterium]
MEVILLQQVTNLGELGDKVRVRPGYGRNFLIPQGYALPATKANLEVFEARRAELEKAAYETLGAAKSRAERMEGLSVTIGARTTEGGEKLYGSVGPQEISDAVTAQGVELEKSEIDMPDGPIKELGEFEVIAHLHAEVLVPIKVVVEAEEVA